MVDNFFVGEINSVMPQNTQVKGPSLQQPMERDGGFHELLW
jgi:hypothetical protein